MEPGEAQKCLAPCLARALFPRRCGQCLVSLVGTLKDNVRLLDVGELRGCFF